MGHLAQHRVTYKVAFRGCGSLLPLLLGSTELLDPREVPGRAGVGGKVAAALPALRVRKESSASNSSTVRHTEYAKKEVNLGLMIVIVFLLKSLLLRYSLRTITCTD